MTNKYPTPLTLLLPSVLNNDSLLIISKPEIFWSNSNDLFKIQGLAVKTIKQNIDLLSTKLIV